MLHTTRAYAGMVTAPHHLAAQAGLEVMRDGGNAIEAMIAAASTIAVVYPHMNGLGGDGFWLVGRHGEGVEGIQACGRSAALASRDWYHGQGLAAIPGRGPLAALTVAGAVSGWQAAHELSRSRHGGRLPLARLLEEAIRHAREGVAVTRTLHENAAAKLAELRDVPGFADAYLRDGTPLPIGARLRQERVAETLARLAEAGLDDFYRGELARSMAAELEAAGSPLRLGDLEGHRAELVVPLSAGVAGHRVYNMPPPTQGLASLLLLALYAPILPEQAEGFDFVHRLVECTKAAFRVRDRHVGDPAYMTVTADSFLAPDSLERLAAGVSTTRAAPWPHPAQPGDTVWLGAIDRDGLAVSYIQSVYWEFGSGIVLPTSGVTWQNRGTSFSLAEAHPNRLDPKRLPFHTIQPAMAELSDGRMMVHGTMGGEGQPQTQAMVFARHVLHGMPLQQAVTAPRWLLGRTWGAATTNLKIEDRIGEGVIAHLRAAGHDVEVVGPYAEMMGHAGAILRHPGGLLEGATDPRSNGAVAAR
ncbi:gamma-glutamyltransferase family protein [Limibaculum sp. FT325]|uniref:gamma-glutamyltransferase family protein n=1 Tax=Thermohalobaculum sediminis TaxID=2939436 RepID=UPI0020BE2EC4|nr:gamma-glutamyltransferase family protein [Limibaculum sediminis]MCL5777190.1 gamma-glutamyltransferase family protein [Limibaculum sediminis]